MIAIVLIGVMVDRPTLTFRTLTVAALGVLLLAPEAVVHPSFQMSFAATLALVAGYQHGLALDDGRAPTRRSARASRCGAGARSWAWSLVSLLAGTATMPYVAYHFHRLAPYGVLANLLAMPVVSAWVMPAGILGLLAHAVRLRRLLLAADGRGHRVDDRGRALGHQPSGRGRTHGGVRHRPAAALHAGPRRALPAQDAAAAASALLLIGCADRLGGVARRSPTC